MSTKKPLVKAYIEKELKEKFKDLCDIEKRSESNMIEYLIDKYVKEYEARQATTITKPENINISKSKGVVAGDNNGTIKVK